MASIWDDTQGFDRMRADIRYLLQVRGPPRVSYTPHPGQPFTCDLGKHANPSQHMVVDWKFGLYIRMPSGDFLSPTIAMLVIAWRLIEAGDRRILRICTPTNHEVSHLYHNKPHPYRTTRTIPQLPIKMSVVYQPTAPEHRKHR